MYSTVSLLDFDACLVFVCGTACRRKTAEAFSLNLFESSAVPILFELETSANYFSIPILTVEIRLIALKQRAKLLDKQEDVISLQALQREKHSQTAS